MNKIVLICAMAIATVTMAACTPKASKPVAGNKPVDPIPTKSEMLSHYTSERLEEGKVVYVGNCARCHKLPVVEKFDNEQWVKILKRMVPKAKLNEQDAELVRAYVIANSK